MNNENRAPKYITPNIGEIRYAQLKDMHGDIVDEGYFKWDGKDWIREENDSFICKGCGHELELKMQIKTEGHCYLCDPNVTVEELINDYDNKLNSMSTHDAIKHVRKVDRIIDNISDSLNRPLNF